MVRRTDDDVSLRRWAVIAGLPSVTLGAATALSPFFALGAVGLAGLILAPPMAAVTLLAVMAYPIVFLPIGTGGLASAAVGLAAVGSTLLRFPRESASWWAALQQRRWPWLGTLALAIYLTAGASPWDPLDWRIVLLWSTSIPVFFFAYVSREARLLGAVALAGSPVAVGLLLFGPRPFGINPISVLLIVTSVTFATAAVLRDKPMLVGMVLSVGGVLVLFGEKTGPKVAFAVAFLHFVWSYRGTQQWFAMRGLRAVLRIVGLGIGVGAATVGIREAFQRLRSPDIIQSRSVTVRLDYWAESLAQRDPLGAGIGAQERPHNLVLEAWAATGVLGLTVVVGLLIGATVFTIQRRSIEDSFVLCYLMISFTSGGLAESWTTWLALGWLLSPVQQVLGPGDERSHPLNAKVASQPCSPSRGRASRGRR